MDLSAIITPVLSIGGMGLLFGFGLGIAAKKFAVPVDTRVEEVLAFLPGANCGGCGQPGCEAMSKAMVSGTCGPDACPVCQSHQVTAIAKILGIEAKETEKKVAFVRCQGSHSKAKEKFIYQGIRSCEDAQLVGGGPKLCDYGCLGLGSCQKACHFDAITMQDGLPQINREQCVGCGACATQCPRSVISLIPVNSSYEVACLSEERGKAVKSACEVGCLGCGLCVKQCLQGAITLVKQHAVIDANLCIGCGACESKCPTHAITALLPSALAEVASTVSD